jgi:DNA (cytosine-5)-methyltransferase 1
LIYDHTAGTLSDLDRQVVEAVPPGGNWRDLPLDFPSQRIEQIRRGAASGGGSRSTYYGRLSWDRPSYTISTFFSRPGNGAFIHPEASRLITVREAARLQSFPDSYRFSGKGRARFVQVGNAVPPLLAYQMVRGLEQGAAVDLFCGAGGLSLGLEWAGFDVIAAVDNNQKALTTYQINRVGDDTTWVTDLADEANREVVLKEIKRRAGSHGVTLLAGGPPCQGFSTAGNCLTDDPRNRLVYAFVESVEELEPRFVLMENVPALLFSRGRHVLAEIRSALHKLGYSTTVIIAHAEGYGIPQLRRRLLMMATKGRPSTWPEPWREILAPHHLPYQPHAELATTKATSVWEAISDLPRSEAADTDTAAPLVSDPTSDYQRWARSLIPIEGLIPTDIPRIEWPSEFEEHLF